MKRKREFRTLRSAARALPLTRAALAFFRRKMEAGADKTESQLAEGKHSFLKKFDQNLLLLVSFVWVGGHFFTSRTKFAALGIFVTVTLPEQTAFSPSSVQGVPFGISKVTWRVRKNLISFESCRFDCMTAIAI